jgi:hypothetical protein
MSKGKVAYVYSQARNERTTQNLNDSAMSEYDHLTRYFESTQDIAYTVLWDVVVATSLPNNDQPLEEQANHTAATPVVHQKKQSSLLLSHTKLDNIHSCQKDHTNDESMSGLRREGVMCREYQQVGDCTKIFLAIAWVFKPELRFFKLFPEVIHVDATSHSTHKKYDLLTFSVKTSFGRQVVFLRVWLPDQTRYSFRWVFQHVLIGLLPKEFFLRTRLIMSDGDRQQQQEIEAAIREYMPNARLGSCGWHIVDRGWRRNGPTTNVFQSHRKKKEVQQALFQVVRRWIYSWMRPGYCETQEEYQVSSTLLHQFIDSPLFRTTVDGRLDIIAHLKQFLRQNILVHKDLFLHYLRRKTQFLDIAHNSAHEGTNHGMKANAAAVLPGHSPVAAAERMVVQSFVTVKQLEEESHRTFQQKKQWSTLPTAAHVVPIAESILVQQAERNRNYVAVRVAYACFHVEVIRDHQQNPNDDEDLLNTCDNHVYGDHVALLPFESIMIGQDESNDNDRIGAKENDGSEDNSKGENSSNPCCPIPRFHRTRTVNYNADTSEFTCDCFQFERIGIPCVHIYNVIKNLDPSWGGFTHHQVSIRWWSVYISKGYPSGSSCPTSRAVATLASNDLGAPSMPRFGSILATCTWAIVAASPPQPAWQRVINYYTEDDLHRIFLQEPHRCDQGTCDFMGHSQTTYDPGTQDDEVQFSNNDQDDEAEVSNDQEEDEVCSGNLLFKQFEEVADSNKSTCAPLERKLHAFLSMYPALGSDEQLVANERVDTLLALTRADYVKNQKTSAGTCSIVVEGHGTRARTFNTHNAYYG